MMLLTDWAFWLAGPVDKLALSVPESVQIDRPWLSGFVDLAVIGGGVGLAGAWLAVSSADIKPRKYRSNRKLKAKNQSR